MRIDAGYYGERYWQGEPTTGVGITHAVGLDVDLDPVAACGRLCDTMADYKVPSTQLVTCLLCWAHALKPWQRTVW